MRVTHKILCFAAILVLSGVHRSCHGCIGGFNEDISRMLRLNNIFGPSSSEGSGGNEISGSQSITRINSPGQRFTATHGITAKAGEKRLFVFVVDRQDVNYMAVSSNIAIEGTRGGPERYELYMKYGKPPSTTNYDQRSVLTASDSYIGDVLYSRDITVPRPQLGEYYFLLVAYKDFHELLVTAILDTPPDERSASFTIRRIGEYAH